MLRDQHIRMSFVVKLLGSCHLHFLLRSNTCIALFCRYPFLLVDRVVEVEYGKYAVGYKNVTVNDNFFTGHFPDRPIMPGTAQRVVLYRDLVSGSGIG